MMGVPLIKRYLNQGGNLYWERKKCSQNLMLYKISPRVLVFLMEVLFSRLGSFGKPTRWDFAITVTQGWKSIPDDKSRSTMKSFADQ